MQEINQHFWTDGEKIFYRYGKKECAIPDVDIASFNIEGKSLASDKNRIYAISYSRSGLQIFEEADRENVIFIPQKFSRNHTEEFFVDNHHLYAFDSGWKGFIQYQNIFLYDDIKQWLQEHYPRKNAWWHNNTSFYNALKPLKNNIYTNGQDIFYYFDAQYAECYDVPSYSRDMSDRENNQQSAFLALRNTEASTFISLNCFYSKDAQRVYFYSKVILADADTFEVLDGLFAKDKNHVYIDRGQTLKKGLDGKSFIILNSYWGKDDFVVYSISSEKIMKNIDHETFRIIDENGKAEDKNYTYEFDYNGLKKKAK